jgi:hypothetical protein
MIRRIGRRRNEGPSAVVKRLAEQELQRTVTVSQDEFERRMRAWDELAERYPPPDDGLSWAEIEAEMQSLFDYLDEEGAESEPKSVTPAKA